MTNPGCIVCGQPVKRCRPSDHGPKGRPLRIIDGRCWRWHCGPKCGAHRHRRPPLPPTTCRMCPTLLTDDQKRRKQPTCSKTCGGKFQRGTYSPAGLAARMAALERANAKRHEHFVKRVVAAIVADCQPWIHELPRDVRVNVVKVAVKYRRLGYNCGYSAHYQRRTNGRMQQAARPCGPALGERNVGW